MLVLWPLEINHFNSKQLNSIEPKLNCGLPVVLPVNTVFNSVASFVDLTDAIPTSPHSHCARPPYLHSTPAALPAVPLPSQSSTRQHLCHVHQTNSYPLKFLKCFPIVNTHDYFSVISYNGILSFLKHAMFMHFSELCKSWVYPLRFIFLTRDLTHSLCSWFK